MVAAANSLGISSGLCWPSPSISTMNLAFGRAHAAFHRRAIANIVGMAHDVSAGRHGDIRAAVAGAVIDDDDFAIGQLEGANLAK